MLTAADQTAGSAIQPTIVLVHGAWADASSWAEVIARLRRDGYHVRAIPNELRSLAGDAGVVRAFLDSHTGPVVLVAHSYGGAVITNAATGIPGVAALVYVNAFVPDEGESAFQLAGADSALAVPDPTTVFDLVPSDLPPTPASDVYLKESAVSGPFAAGLSSDEQGLVYATQRPATFGALTEASGAPAWKTIPSRYVLGLKDQIIPPSAQRSMAERAGAVVTEYGAGHLGLLSDPQVVVHVIEEAARDIAAG
ncbi:alpha/beta fold hydrolase [Microbacterium yannicii]|uniref:alpha/beta fold hydrolase n=1 Tax=Microbacterium yannicii TaxID=671622 RepID=UPI00030ACAC8|nr:alpha/beta hydrolase [Microbacterium yannicii]